MDVAVPIGINKVKALDVIQRYCRLPFLKIFRFVHREPLLDLLHLIHASISDSINTVVGSQRRAMD